MPDLVAVVRHLPRGLCGVVFRHDGAPGRHALGRQVLMACRSRQLLMVAAAPFIQGAGTHLRGGRGHKARGAGPITASAHGVQDLVRARRAGAWLAFLSPAFPTPSHPGAPALGPARWAAARHRVPGLPVLALGGIDPRSLRRLPRSLAGIGAIGALLP